MAITTYDGALAGMQPLAMWQKLALVAMVANRPVSLWGIGGCPGLGTFNSTLNGAVYSSTSAVPQGAPYRTDPAGGLNAYLAHFSAMAPQVGVMYLCDRLWDNQLTINNTGNQSITSPTWPARDRVGGTNGLGVHLAIETSAATSATAATLTNANCQYTDCLGNGSQTLSFLDAPTGVISQPGYFYRLSEIGTGDGVKSVQQMAFTTAWTSGTVNLVAYRVLSCLELTVANIANRDDALTSGFAQLYNGVCPFLMFVPQTTTAGVISASYAETQG